MGLKMDSDKYTILVVDDIPSNITFLSSLLKEKYKVKVAISGEKAISIVKISLPDLILLDIMMPGLDGYETCRIIKSDPETSSVPIIFLTAKSSVENESMGLELGAADYIIKPINPEVLFLRIRTQLALKEAADFLKDKNEYLQNEVRKRIKEIETVQDIAITAIVSLAETRDTETGRHVKRTQLYVRELAEELRRNGKYREYLTDSTIRLIVKSAPLHDIGKVGIADKILLKPGKLTNDEFEVMKTHTKIGRMAIEKAENITGESQTFFKFAKEIIYSHHEKWNGSGYPERISKDMIPLSARIMAVADVYDAIVNKRVYKPEFSHEYAVNAIKQDSEKQFDPDIVQAFLNIQDKFKEIAEKLKD